MRRSLPSLFVGAQMVSWICTLRPSHHRP